jgi:hypothetical protein
MILKLRIGHTRITFTLARVIDVLGVNSKLPDGNHILMWDFDKTPLWKINTALFEVQEMFSLPDIYILQTSPPDNYIAYCFKSCTWTEARAIVGMTKFIDEAFYKWAVFRRRFTLRVGEKLGTKPHLVDKIPGYTWDTATIDELKSWVKYETLDGHHNQQVTYVELP